MSSNHEDLARDLAALPVPEPRERRYALVDLAQLSSEQRRLLRADRLPPGARLFDHDAVLERQRDIGAVLVDLTGAEQPSHESHAFCVSLVESGRGLAQASWLVSAAPVAGLSQHLARYLKVALPDQRRALLRFYDAWLLPRFVRVLSPAQWTDFMQLASQWRAMQPDGTWVDLRTRPERFVVEEGAAPPAEAGAAWPMAESQHRMMVYAGLPGQVMRRYFDEQPVRAQARTRAQVYAEGVSTMRKAARHGVAEIDDLEAIMMIGLLNGPAFVELPAVHEQFAQLDAGADFQQVLMRLAAIRA
ncbi:DUF4123 domain-containing protein [Paraburkholderia acidisoli]|nr:DUF4123 domain-containing protein [Paraburkholderia acidisoli]